MEFWRDRNTERWNYEKKDVHKNVIKKGHSKELVTENGIHHYGFTELQKDRITGR